MSLCIIVAFSKYAWVIPLKEKKSSTITSTFQKLSDKSGHKPNKIWIDKGSEFYKILLKHVWEKDYVCNSSTCPCEINRYLKSIADDLVITCDKIIGAS